MKLLRKIRIKNTLGLHARPATVIAKLLQGTASHVSFTYRKETINARSMMSILMLAAIKNSLITIVVDGEDAEMTMQKIVDAFENSSGNSMKPEEEIKIRGFPVSDGIAIGIPFFLQSGEKEIPEFPITLKEVDEEIARYRSALFSSREDLTELRNHLAMEASDDAATIIDSHISNAR